jgi:hypothetical protein
MTARTLTEQQAKAMHDVLVAECGASPDDQYGVLQAFLRYATQTPRLGALEWRFCGALGFGGKWYWDGRRAYVSCYPEDRTPEREAMVERANARLAAL